MNSFVMHTQWVSINLGDKRYINEAIPRVCLDCMNRVYLSFVSQLVDTSYIFSNEAFKVKTSNSPSSNYRIIGRWGKGGGGGVACTKIACPKSMDTN